MTRRTQNQITWSVALGLIVAQATPWVKPNAILMGAALVILGFLPARSVQDFMDKIQNGNENGVKK